MFKTLLKHNVTNCNGFIFCHCCMSKQQSLDDAILHTDKKQHKVLKNDETNQKCGNHTKERRELLVDNKITITKSHIFVCIPCQQSFNDYSAIIQHIQSTRHIVTLQTHNINVYSIHDKVNITSIMSRYKSKKKKVYVVDATKAHIHTLLQNNDTHTNEKCETLVNNGILLVEYYMLMCLLCQLVPDDILMHVKDITHICNLRVTDIKLGKEYVTHCTNVDFEINGNKRKPNLIEKENLNDNNQLESCNNCDKDSHRILIDNGIKIIDTDNLWCVHCKRKFPSVHDTLSHIKGRAHKSVVEQLKAKTDISKSKYITNENSSTIGSTDKQSAETLEDKTNMNRNQKQSLSSMTDDIVLSKKLQNKKQDYIDLDDSYYCELCSIQIDTNNLFEHFTTITHKCNIHIMSMGDDIILFKCLCCKSILQGNSSLIKHLSTETHLNNLTKILKYIETMSKKCYVCNILFPVIENGCTYFNEKCLVSFDTKDIKFCNELKTNIPYECSLCSIKLGSKHNLIEHFRGRVHLWRLKQLFTGRECSDVNNDAELITNQLNNLSISNAKLQSTNNDNNLIIPRDVHTQIMKFLRDSPLQGKPMKYAKTNNKTIERKLSNMYKKYFEIEDKMYTMNTKKFEGMEMNLKLLMPNKKKSFHCMACNVNVPEDIHLIYEHVCLKPHIQNANKLRENKDTKKLLSNYMVIQSKNVVKCYLCKNTTVNQPELIKKHINSKPHETQYKNIHEIITNTHCSIKQELDILWYSIVRFSCVVCKEKFPYKFEFVQHILLRHIQSLDSYMFDSCIPCATLWLNKTDVYTEHCSDMMHKYLIKSKDLMIEDLPECIRQLLTQVDKTIYLLHEEINFGSLLDCVVEDVIESLENSLRPHFPLVKAFLFGSRFTGLGSIDSDIDIYLDCENTYYDNGTKSSENDNLTRIAQILQKQTGEWEVRKIIKDTRVPIIRLIYKVMGIPCDISILNGLAVENSKLIRSFIDAFAPCKILILFIRKWFSLFNLPSNGGGVSNCAITWFVIFYLQSELYLPSVAALISEQNNSQLVCGWETGVAKPKCNANSVKSIPVLLQNFFEFYKNFDYRYYIVCPLMGVPVAKEAFIKPNTLPTRMKPYIRHINTSKEQKYFRIDSPLCVQDPFNLSDNMTKSVSSIMLKCFKQYCSDSASILLSTKH